METFIPTKESLEEVLSKVVDDRLTDILPSIIRKATRKELLDTSEVMKITGWSKRTIQNIRDQRRLKFFQDGHKILYRYDDLEAYLESIGIETKVKD